jgi:tRNA (guanine-N7-)-methyltransferase
LGGAEKTAAEGCGPARAPRIFGRRIGRPLRPAQQDALGTLLPVLRLDLGTIGTISHPHPGPLPQGEGTEPTTADRLGSPLPQGEGQGEGAFLSGKTILEIGFGNGEHFCSLLRAHPDANLIGSEVFLNGIASLLTRLLRDEAEVPFRDRVRLWPDDARALVERLADACIDQAFLLFPDPWPKARHAERRIVQPGFLMQVARTLKHDGRLTVATDHPVYRAWVEEVLPASPALRVTGREDRALTDPPRTRYEAKAFREGRQSTWWVIQRA